MIVTIPNTFHDDPEQIASGDDVTENFNALASVINGNLDDTNISALSGSKITDGTLTSSKYGTGSVGTTALGTAAVTAAKCATGMVTSTVLGTEAVRDANIDYTVANVGAKVLRVGPSSLQFGAEGLRLCRCAMNISAGASGWLTVAITFSSSGTDGDPSYSVAPTPVGIVYVVNSTNAVDIPTNYYFTTITTTVATAKMNFSGGTSAVAGTLYAIFIGPTAS